MAPAYLRLLSKFALPVLLASALSMQSAEPKRTWTARITNSPPDLASFGLPPHLVAVAFPMDVPTNLVRALSSYSLSEAANPGKQIQLRGAKPLGGAITPPSTNTTTFKALEAKTNDSRTARGVWLLPLEPIDPAASYTLNVVFGNDASPPIPVEPVKASEIPAADTSGSELTRILRFSSNVLSGRLSLQIDARVPFDASKSLAVDYRAGFDFVEPHLRPAKDYLSAFIYSGGFTSDGTLKLDSSDTNVTDHINLSAAAQAIHLFDLEDPLSKGGLLTYYYGVRLKAVEFESDQHFRAVNLTVKPQLAFWVPYSNIPALWWSRSIGISGNAATPLSLFVGYTFSEALRKDPARVDPAFQKSDRLEGELAYAFPLTSNLRVGMRVRLFWLYDQGTFRDYEELFVRRYLDKNKITSVEFKYINGAVPPKFERGNTASAGFSFEF
jgi:hypothetical protein